MGDNFILITMDNDVLLAKDEGYTNGLFFSWLELGIRSQLHPKASKLLYPIEWTLLKKKSIAKVNTHTIGQIMITPKDISRENPDPYDMPYAGYLFYSTSHICIYEDVADRISFTIGIIGPASGAEYVQIKAHEITGSTEPKGWDFQLENEAVFQFSRNCIWRTWASGNGQGNFDMLFSVEGNLGTFSSSLGADIIYRFGSDLYRSFASPTLDSSRVSNPLSVDGGWYVYLGFSTQYIANLIFVDGNTFQNSRSIPLDHIQTGVVSGISYSLKNFSLTVAVEDYSIFKEQKKGRLHFGTLTVALRF